jgi:anti-sigma-K factor RskA
MITLQDDPDLLAAEYVLGSLSSEEREEVEHRVRVDFAFAAAIAVWERRLGPLNQLIAPQTPPDGVWQKISARIDDVPQITRERKVGFVDVVEMLSRSRGVDVAEKMMRDVKRWRMAAIAASLVAVLLAGYLGASAVGANFGLFSVSSATAAQKNLR